MKRFLLSKRALLWMGTTACAVVFLFLTNYVVSERTLFEHIFSSKRIYVGTFDVKEKSNPVVETERIKKPASQFASVKSVAQKPKTIKSLVIQSTSINITQTSSSNRVITPEIYIAEIQTGDEGSARNEFVKICNRGGAFQLKSTSLKKKSFSGTEETLLNAQWENMSISELACVYVANNDAVIPHETLVRWAKSHALAEKSNTLLLYIESKLVDEVFWSQIPKGKRIIRESPTSSWHISD